MGLMILQSLGYPIYFWALIDNWGDIKSLVLFGAALAFAGYKLFDKHLDSSKKKLNLRILRENVKVNAF